MGLYMETGAGPVFGMPRPPPMRSQTRLPSVSRLARWSGGRRESDSGCMSGASPDCPPRTATDATITTSPNNLLMMSTSNRSRDDMPRHAERPIKFSSEPRCGSRCPRGRLPSSFRLPGPHGDDHPAREVVVHAGRLGGFVNPFHRERRLLQIRALQQHGHLLCTLLSDGRFFHHCPTVR